MLTGDWRRSSRCSSGGCVEARWRKSPRSGANGCVEVADGDVVQVRDSKTDGSPVLTFGPERWAEFVAAVNAGQFRP